MTYNRDKDECVAEIGEVDTNNGVIRVALWSYAGGDTKLGLARTFTKGDGTEGIRAIGRMTKEELEGVLPLLEKALAEM